MSQNTAAKRVSDSVTETDVPDNGDKRQRDGIGGETSVTVVAVDNKPLSVLIDAVSAPCTVAYPWGVFGCPEETPPGHDFYLP